MILIGQYDSPFVRRVAIVMRLYGFDFEHRPWSVFGDAEKIAAFNPLRRVPTLILDQNEVLIESYAILDYLDGIADPETVLIPQRGLARREALKICALATGLVEKTVAIVYESALHNEISSNWVGRCETQIAAVLAALETERAHLPARYWLGDRIGHADIAVACAIGFLMQARPQLFNRQKFPALSALSVACEAMPEFGEIRQPFQPPS